MEIKFYEIKRRDVTEGLMKGVVESKGASKGCVKVKSGKLYIKIKDKNLKKILNQPYTVRVREKDKDGKLFLRTVVHQPGELEHLKAFASGCWQFGYLAKIKR
ncbi:MAG: hypothetical protein NC818_07000 [Candidatus Omnitrophica bacterium]|nr:hypothetical protein [Candidatus Omnitrophota bacterium]